ncbi:unnamed protein product [Trichobilharzia regenti]|nr:unnamed protein product [Trichobilharzia regenti]
MRAKYPQLVAELLRNGRGTKLPPGAPCDNYRGYCDVFMRCVSVDAEGPLARLRNLIFSPQMLQKVKTWITIHWWAVILISVAVIIGMIVFVKVCSVSTPTARAHSIDRNKPTLPPFLTSNHISPEAVDHPVIWTVTSHPLRWLGSPNPPASNRRFQSPWGWSRRPKGAEVVIRCPPTSERTCILPTAPLIELPFLPVPGGSKTAEDIQPIDSGAGDMNIEFLQQHNFYQRMPRSRSSQPRPNSVLIPSTSESFNHVRIRQPKIPSKLGNGKVKKKLRPVSEYAANNCIPAQVNCRIEEEIQPRVSENSPRILRTNISNHSRSIPPPSYDDL